MKRIYKNTYGDGRVEYVEYEIADPVPEDEELTAEEALAIISGGADDETQ